MNQVSWRDRAACKGSDPALFFPDRGDRYTAARALAVCQRCPVRPECIEYNMAMPAHLAKNGIWGGMTEEGRRTMRRARRTVA